MRQHECILLCHTSKLAGCTLLATPPSRLYAPMRRAILCTYLYFTPCPGRGWPRTPAQPQTPSGTRAVTVGAPCSDAPLQSTMVLHAVVFMRLYSCSIHSLMVRYAVLFMQYTLIVCCAVMFMQYTLMVRCAVICMQYTSIVRRAVILMQYTLMVNHAGVCSLECSLVGFCRRQGMMTSSPRCCMHPAYAIACLLCQYAPFYSTY